MANSTTPSKLEQSIAAFMTQEISNEIDKDILNRLNFTQEFIHLQAQCKRIYDARELFDSESVISFAKFVVDLEWDNVQGFSNEDEYNNLSEIKADWGQILHEMNDMDKFSFALVSTG